MRIEHAADADLKACLEIYANARKFMAEHGNPDQWRNHPSPEVVKADIAAGNLYVLRKDDGVLAGVFVFAPVPDPTYLQIYEGSWLDDRPYWVIHRLASALTEHGVFKAIADWCFAKADSIRIDTHEDNIPMQKALEKYGFYRCGIIFVEDGSRRIAYQLDSNPDAMSVADTRKR